MSGRAAAGMLVVIALGLAACGGSRTVASPSSAAPQAHASRAWTNEAGLRHLHFQTAPIDIRPGQNTIQNVTIPARDKPAVDGYIVGMRPNLRYLNGKVPAVNILHLHHGVWVDGTRGPFFFGGEEKTAFHIPRGYGLPYKVSDRWKLNQMIHNLLPNATRARLTWDLDFIPATTALARTVTPVTPIWMDVRSGESYPVFNTLRGTGRSDGTFTYPTDAKTPYAGRPMNEVQVPFDATIVSAVGHLHPGGLHDDIEVVRPGATLPAKRACSRVALDITDSRSATRCATATAGSVPHSVRIFRSEAHYYEPAGPVSWDVSLTASRPDWRVQIHKGETLRITTTYANRDVSWYENMGIVLLYVAPKDRTGVDPFAKAVDWKGVLTHGHLPENDVHGGAAISGVDARAVAAGPVAREVRIKNYVYNPGDLSQLGGSGTRVPTIPQGQSLLFVNQDHPRFEWHSITTCAAPCNRSTGIAYPLADAPAPSQFDSGQLGLDSHPPGATPATNALTWKTPSTLRPGTYTYFCRIHPFMRGAFRVIKSIG
jgi:plastocyanin